MSDVMDRELLVVQIARELDKPSIYMGGPSNASRRKAEEITRLVETAYGQSKAVKEKDACRPEEGRMSDCERCEGGGNFSEMAPCTTFGPDCGCQASVLVDPCPDCKGTGVRPLKAVKEETA